MMNDPVCPNGHPFPRATVVRCEKCEAGVICIPSSEGLRLHDLLENARQAELLGEMWILSADDTAKRLGADLLQVLRR
jgi:hypothetical protein